jgi:hypothetical protein
MAIGSHGADEFSCTLGEKDDVYLHARLFGGRQVGRLENRRFDGLEIKFNARPCLQIVRLACFKGFDGLSNKGACRDIFQV